MASIEVFCSCGKKFPLQQLYFCRTCSIVKCKNCITQEIDTIFCPNCMETVPSVEATLFMNRCSKCFDCPVCSATVQIVAGLTEPLDYFFSCGCCKWNSLALGLVSKSADDLTAVTVRRERDSDLQKETVRLIEQYQRIAREEAKERDRQKRFGRKVALKPRATKENKAAKGAPTAPGEPPVIDAVSVAATEEKRLQKEVDLRVWQPYNRGSLLSILSPPKEPTETETTRARTGSVTDSATPTAGTPTSVTAPVLLGAAPTAPVAPPAATSFPDATELATASQRRTDLEHQAELLSSLPPVRKQLMVKRSKRCRACEHNVIKPEVNPNSVKFKIQHVAMNYLPTVSIVPPLPALRVGQDVRLQLSITNLVEGVLGLSFEAPQPGDVIPEKFAGAHPTVFARVPQRPTYIGGFNEIADLDDIPDDDETSVFKTEDNKDEIALRAGNRIVVNVNIQPADSEEAAQFIMDIVTKVKEGEDVKENRYTLCIKLGAVQPKEAAQ